MNRNTEETYDLLGDWSVDQANTWLAAYCRNNPDEVFAIAVHQMLETVYPTRQKSAK
ncbi:MAG: hypothetical protein O3A96_07325 [Proteobacteria bacterium]|nr:hypothetical protein [Pseudomonadota bacterium]